MAGAGLVELTVALEELGARAAPGPILPTVLVSAVLLASGAIKARDELLPRLADGSRVGALFVGRAACVPGSAAQAASLTGRRGDDGLLISGAAEPVLGATVADVIVLPVATDAGEEWVAVDGAELTITELPSMDPVRRVAKVEAHGVTVAPDRVLDGLTGADVLDVAAVLFGAEAAGVAGWCVTTAADYAKVREQFGRPIGQFQGIKHLCARMLVALEQARAVVWDAARALDEAEATGTRANADSVIGDTDASHGADHRAGGARLAAAIAAVVAVDAGVICAQDCIQVHGGIGYTWEHDAHIYFRRALALRALAGPAARWADRAATLALRGAKRELDIELPADAEPMREGIASEIAGIAALPRDQQAHRLAAEGLVMPHLPKPWGRGAGPAEQILIQQEMRAAGVRPPFLMIGAWVVPSLASHGTPEQQQRFLPATLRGEIVWCQLFSEPGSGSDLASLQMRAAAVDGGWKLTGQKIWTSLAREAEWAICLARTDSARPKHEGITYFLVDMKSPGIEVRPLTEMTGDELFNEVFFDDVFVPDDMVVGEVNEGWKVARNTLGNERVSLSSSATAGLSVKELLDVARGAGPDPAAREHIGRLVGEGQSLALLALRVTLSQLSGTEPGAASSVRKLLAMEHAQHIAEASWSLLGARGAVAGALTSGPEGYWARMILATRAMTIYGGTSQVQLNIIGERMLGLPRDP